MKRKATFRIFKHYNNFYFQWRHIPQDTEDVVVLLVDYGEVATFSFEHIYHSPWNVLKQFFVFKCAFHVIILLVKK